MSKKHLGLKANLFIILTLFILLLSIKIDAWLYPVKYEEEIHKYCIKYNVETNLVQAVITTTATYSGRMVTVSGAVTTFILE